MRNGIESVPGINLKETAEATLQLLLPAKLNKHEKVFPNLTNGMNNGVYLSTINKEVLLSYFARI